MFTTHKFCALLLLSISIVSSAPLPIPDDSDLLPPQGFPIEAFLAGRDDGQRNGASGYPGDGDYSAAAAAAPAKPKPALPPAKALPPPAKGDDGMWKGLNGYPGDSGLWKGIHGYPGDPGYGPSAPAKPKVPPPTKPAPPKKPAPKKGGKGRRGLLGDGGDDGESLLNVDTDDWDDDCE